MNHIIAVEEDIDRQIRHIRDMMNLAGQDVTALPGRQILQIRNARYHTSGYLPNRAGTPTSQAYVVFQGEPTPSSQATGGILRFVPDEEMRVPVYDATRGTIQLWVDWVYVSMVMEQLKHRRHYLWIGFFDNGHAFADLYSDP
ncbi:hypothetical protein [Aliiruegeria sabulilitoris]|uniref:hypothetical protein n=1 Tax=Aliiruegeria sabulilitoris TaxID=1510458 RepID=UPI0012E3E90F|nr:hypothetical protein [Aliiruegeria sabulilitoris]NDR55225.1 hypothetical protein [Pseudoruegeria sp. M32A2M]